MSYKCLRTGAIQLTDDGQVIWVRCLLDSSRHMPHCSDFRGMNVIASLAGCVLA